MYSLYYMKGKIYTCIYSNSIKNDAHGFLKGLLYVISNDVYSLKNVTVSSQYIV